MSQLPDPQSLVVLADAFEQLLGSRLDPEEAPHRRSLERRVLQLAGVSVLGLLAVSSWIAVWAIAVLVGSLQRFAVSLSGLRRRVAPHWKRGMSFLRIDLTWLQQSVANASGCLLAWMSIPLRQLKPCIPSRGVYRCRKQSWFTNVDLPPQPRQSAPLAVA